MRTIPCFFLLAGALGVALPALAQPHSSLDIPYLGLYRADSFRQETGRCAHCPTPRQALWYFENDLVAVPAEDTGGLPSLVWLGSPLQQDGTLSRDGQFRAEDRASAHLLLSARLPSNRAWWDASTTRFLADRPLRVSGVFDQQDRFIARTVWPRDDVLAPSAVQPLRANESLQTLVRQPVSRFSTRVLWQRQPGQAWDGKPALGFMLNGAQGDDDEAHGGHFAVATGIVGAGGAWSDWLVNNFYNLDAVSEKGIIAAQVPMDRYLMDVNSGQQFYRPSTMLVAILKDGRTAQVYQTRIQQVFDLFYRHQFRYRHATRNCAGISIDVFRELGWNVPRRGPTSSLKAVGAWAYLSVKERSFASGRAIYDYLTEEQTRLYPAVAFDALGNDLLRLLTAPLDADQLNIFERQLREDVEAVVLLSIPQVPSSRALGSAPVYSFDEFMQRTPPDRADWKTVPTAPRPFPAALREPGSPAPAEPSPVPAPIAGFAGGVVGIGFLWRRTRRAR